VRRRSTLLALVALGLGVGREGAAGAADAPDENPRNRRWEAPYIEYLAATPPASVERVGEPLRRTSDAAVEWTAVVLATAESAHHRPSSGGGIRIVPGGGDISWMLDGGPREPVRARGAPDRVVRTPGDGRRRELWCVIGDLADSSRVMTDALPVRVCIEARTAKAWDLRFGSAVRRVRASLDAWNELAASSVWPFAPNGLLDRFRIDDVLVFAREAGSPVVGRPPTAALAIVFDEDGRDATRYDPSTATIAVSGKGVPHGSWSVAGERALWRELVRSRGIAPLAEDPLPEGATKLAESAAVIANANRGIAWTGDPDDPANVKCGPTWSWIPPRLDVAVTKGGVPVPGARVSWVRARPLARGKEPGVEPDAAPDLSATTDAAGKASLLPIDLGRSLPPEQRSRWALLQVTSSVGNARRVVTALELNVLYATGGKFFSTLSVPLAP
jgi:hypothetical protein